MNVFEQDNTEELSPEQKARAMACEISARMIQGDPTSFHNHNTSQRTQTMLANAVPIYEWIMNG